METESKTSIDIKREEFLTEMVSDIIKRATVNLYFEDIYMIGYTDALIDAKEIIAKGGKL